MNKEIYKQIKHQGYNINVYNDSDPAHPRKEFDNLGTLYTFHHRYCPEEEFSNHFKDEEVFEEGGGKFTDNFLKNYIALPVYIYDHSGQSVSTSPFNCKWDSGLFGIIAIDVDSVKKEYSWNEITPEYRKQIEGYLEGEVKTYDDYLQRNIYGFEIVREDEPDIVLNSCWGYYGEESLKDMETECKCTINFLVLEYKKQVFKRLWGITCKLFNEISNMFRYLPEIIR